MGTGAGTCIKAFQNIYVSRESIDKERNNARAPGGTQSVSQMIAARCHWRFHIAILLLAIVQCMQVYDAEHPSPGFVMHLVMVPKSAPSAEAWEFGGAWLLHS